jgi:hypothetical protein
MIWHPDAARKGKNQKAPGRVARGLLSRVRGFERGGRRVAIELRSFRRTTAWRIQVFFVPDFFAAAFLTSLTMYFFAFSASDLTRSSFECFSLVETKVTF